MVGESEVESVGASILYKTCSPRIGCGRCVSYNRMWSLAAAACRTPPALIGGPVEAACSLAFSAWLRFCASLEASTLAASPCASKGSRRSCASWRNGRRSGSRGAFCKPPASSVGPSDTFFAPICLPVSLSVFSFSCASATLWNVLNARFHAVVYARPANYLLIGTIPQVGGGFGVFL